jgi:hypothetical protein
VSKHLTVKRHLQPPADFLARDQTCIAQHLQVVRKQRRRQVECFAQLAGTSVGAPKFVDQGEPHRVSERAQR